MILVAISNHLYSSLITWVYIYIYTFFFYVHHIFRKSSMICPHTHYIYIHDISIAQPICCTRAVPFLRRTKRPGTEEKEKSESQALTRGDPWDWHGLHHVVQTMQNECVIISLYVYIYVYTYINTYVYIYVYMYIYMYIYIYIHMYVYIYIYTSTYMCV